MLVAAEGRPALKGAALTSTCPARIWTARVGKLRKMLHGESTAPGATHFFDLSGRIAGLALILVDALSLAL